MLLTFDLGYLALVNDGLWYSWAWESLQEERNMGKPIIKTATLDCIGAFSRTLAACLWRFAELLVHFVCGTCSAVYGQCSKVCGCVVLGCTAPMGGRVDIQVGTCRDTAAHGVLINRVFAAPSTVKRRWC